MSAKKPKSHLDQLKQKRADVVASGFKAPDSDEKSGGGGGLIKALREGKPIAGGGDAAGGKRGLALRKLLEAGERAGAGGGEGQPLMQRLRDMQGAGGRLGKTADTAADHAARRARLDRYIADLEKSGGK